MRRGVLYLFLALVRFYFATLPSYIHPDEHFQGPEIIAAETFYWPTHKTWEFTSARPIRSTFPLRLLYQPPLILLKWLAEGLGYQVSPLAVFYVLRAQMFLLSFVLEDWALHELLPIKRERATVLLLVASSYVTWTFQMHSFSNSLETIVVLWCLVLMRRMRADREHTQVQLCVALAFLGVLGVFNRITFPAFLVVSGIQLLPHLAVKPWRMPIMLLAGGLTTLLATAMDTEYYTRHTLHFRNIVTNGVFTPYNNLIYNLDAANLSQHGLHPFWQHFLANLPQLLGPATPLLLLPSRQNTPLFWSAIVGIAILSIFAHQEPRFLLPAIPLLLASLKPPTKTLARTWLAAWLAFNLAAGLVFGVYHQAGVVPVQNWLRQQPDVAHALWWRTYSPPRWLLGTQNLRVNTTDLMGIPGAQMLDQLRAVTICHSENVNTTLLIAPSSATFLDLYTRQPSQGSQTSDLVFQHLYHHHQHIGLDDLDFGEEGVLGTLRRVVGRRGLSVWRVWAGCPPAKG